MTEMHGLDQGRERQEITCTYDTEEFTIINCYDEVLLLLLLLLSHFSRVQLCVTT